ncbi:MAG: DHH family phosphoesterase [Bacilli bacterium]|nr:DHH family phosphoesterase [Bacilli bacterium]
MSIMKEKGKWNKAIKKADTIFLMGHKDLDLDALGSCIGMYIILKRRKKKSYIIIDDRELELGVKKILKELDGCIDIINSQDIDIYRSSKKKDLLMILDTNKEELVQSKEALSKIKDKLIIDHHNLGNDTVKGATIIQDIKASSTCEMITSLIDYYDIEIDSYYATILLSGIVLDTNNFTLNTTSETFYLAYYLTKLGASAKKVQYLLKQDIEEYAEQQKLLSSIETIHGNVAFTKGKEETLYRKQDLARVADTLLFFNNIEASFVIGKTGEDTIGLSARSLGSYDIMSILEKLGGGGDNYNGAAKFERTTISQVEKKLKTILEKEGE